jgi:hypothetical protein
MRPRIACGVTVWLIVERQTASEGERGQPGGASHQRYLVEQQQPPAVEPVGERAADQRQRDERDELYRAQQSGQERRAGLHVELIGQRHQRGLRAEPRHDVAEHEQTQVPRRPQRADVDGDAGHD